ncbi:L,D-transpeptidase family protein [Streptomyces sp. NPDC051740]|uniref:L,D-transpeptidase family protein n=1 Tax=Streptomyces sp. NPDC051740 TaxID=3365673 RepID=UPI0037A0EC2B
MNAKRSSPRGLLTAWAVMTALALTPAALTGDPAGAEAPATTLVFDKNPDDPTDSTLSVHRGGRLRAAYRAGSGLGVQDDCARAKGWIPDGNWRIRSRTRTYDGALIKGYAVRLQDMACSRGTVTRTELFLHSETDRDGGEGTSEARRWDGPGDYESNGCVKLNPTDIEELFRLLDRIGWPTRLRVVP